MCTDSLSPVSRFVNPVVPQSVAVCLISCIIHSICSPPPEYGMSLHLSVCIALSKSLYRHKDRDASTCNFSAMNSSMKHSSESSYYSFPIPHHKSKIPASLHSCKSLHSKHLSALVDTGTLNTKRSVQRLDLCMRVV